MGKNRLTAGFVLTLLLGLAMGSALRSQAPQKEPKTVEQRLEELEDRVGGIEKTLAGLLPAAGKIASSDDARLSRLETRINRLEEQSLRYRPGAPMTGSLPMIESRLRALESEVARLRR